MKLLTNFALYQLGWFALVLGAAADQLWLGSAIAAATIVGHLVSEKAARGLELRRIAWAVALGGAVETLNLGLGVYQTSVGTVGGIFAPWLLLLWAGFGTSLGRSLKWLSGRYGLAALLGAVAGPLAFWGGERLGAIALTREPLLLSLLALEWALVLPALIWISDGLARSSEGVARPLTRAGLAALLFSLLALPNFARAVDAASLKADCAVGADTGIERRGEGRYEYLGFIDVLEAAFFDRPEHRQGSPLQPVPKCLVLEYQRDFSAKQFRKVTVQGVEANVSEVGYTRIAAKVEKFNRLYRDVKAGDRYSVTFFPGAGTVLALNGVSLGLVEGDEFASALFSIWLGKASMDRGLKRDLLATQGAKR